MKFNPDDIIYWQKGSLVINATIAWTWVIMFILVLGSFLITRRLHTGLKISKWQSFLEIIITGISHQIEEVGLKDPQIYISFLGTLFLFIGFANLCIIFPGYIAPTSSLSTTTALALCVFFAVPVFGILKNGIGGYLKTYLQPTFLMLPFNIIGEISRTIALAIRLFGNMMSGGMIVAILLTVAPFIFPVFMNLLGLLTGIVQAYIFSILATVFIAAATSESYKTIKLKST